MDEFIVRLKGKPKEYLDILLKEGYFNTKSEIVRHGILALANKYNVEQDYVVDKDELIKVGKAVKRELRDIQKKKVNYILKMNF